MAREDLILNPRPQPRNKFIDILNVDELGNLFHERLNEYKKIIESQGYSNGEIKSLTRDPSRYPVGKNRWDARRLETLRQEMKDIKDSIQTNIHGMTDDEIYRRKNGNQEDIVNAMIADNYRNYLGRQAAEKYVKENVPKDALDIPGRRPGVETSQTYWRKDIEDGMHPGFNKWMHKLMDSLARQREKDLEDDGSVNDSNDENSDADYSNINEDDYLPKVQPKDIADYSGIRRTFKGEGENGRDIHKWKTWTEIQTDNNEDDLRPQEHDRIGQFLKAYGNRANTPDIIRKARLNPTDEYIRIMNSPSDKKLQRTGEYYKTFVNRSPYFTGVVDVNDSSASPKELHMRQPKPNLDEINLNPPKKRSPLTEGVLKALASRRRQVNRNSALVEVKEPPAPIKELTRRKPRMPFQSTDLVEVNDPFASKQLHGRAQAQPSDLVEVNDPFASSKQLRGKAQAQPSDLVEVNDPFASSKQLRDTTNVGKYRGLAALEQANQKIMRPHIDALRKARLGIYSEQTDIPTKRAKLQQLYRNSPKEALYDFLKEIDIDPNDPARLGSSEYHRPREPEKAPEEKNYQGVYNVGGGTMQRPEPYKEDRLVPSSYARLTSPANEFLGKDWTEMYPKQLHGTDQLADSDKRGIGQKIYDSGEESGRIGKGGGSPDYKEWEGYDYAELPPSEVGGKMRPEEELEPQNQTTLEKFGYGLGALAGSVKRLAKKGYNFAGSALESYANAVGDPLRSKEDEFDPEGDYTEPPEEESGGRSWKDFLSTDGKEAGEKLGTAIGSGVRKASNALTNFSSGISGENEGYGNFGRFGRGIRDIGTNLTSGFNSGYGEEKEEEPEARDLGLFAKPRRLPRDEESPGLFDEQRAKEPNPEMDELLKDTPISRKIGEYAGAGVRGVQDFTKHLGRASEQFEKGIGGDEAYGRAGAAGKGIYNFASALAGSNEGYGGLGKAGAGIRHFGAAVKDKLAEAGSWAARSGRGFLRGVPKGWREWGT